MNKIIAVLIIGAISFTSCGGEGKTEKKDKEGKERVGENEAQKVVYAILPESTTLEWLGYEGDDPGTKFHQGMISISKGELTIENEHITAGNFTVNMESMIETTDGAEEKMSSRLMGHLRSEDFFNISSFPIAEFTIIGSKDNLISGILNVMGQEIEVKIPVETNIEGETISIASEFTVDLSSLNLPGMQLEEGGDPDEKISGKVNFTLRMSAKK